MSQIKEILVYHHSHLDVGYTHTQPVLWELQHMYIDQVLDLCEQTEHEEDTQKFYWTCEVTEPVVKWLDRASESQISRLTKYVQSGQICISALQMHMTPLLNKEQMSRVLYGVKVLRERLGAKINTAISHDVNGHPWSLADHLIDAGVELYTTGINIHFGGIPLNRPSVFRWQTQGGRELLTYHGEHYSLFTQFCELGKKDTKLMKQGLDRYMNRIIEEGWPHDFIYLSATNLPMLDNSSPDIDLLEMITKWNNEGHPQQIRMVTPDILLERLRQIPQELIPLHSGDWTDYWSFGVASSAYETKLSRRSKSSLKTADFLSAMQNQGTKHVIDEAWEQTNLYDEHTWGANISITSPDSPFTKATWMHKAHMAYQSNSLAGYAMHEQLEKLAKNTVQSGVPEGVLLVNASHVEQTINVRVPEEYMIEGRNTPQSRFFHHYTNYDIDWRLPSYGKVTLSPFSYKLLPFNEMEKSTSNDIIKMSEGEVHTPYFQLTYDTKTGRILQLYDKEKQLNVVDPSSNWSFFQFVHESIDSHWHEGKRTDLFNRVLDHCNNNISCWNHDWKALRKGTDKLLSHEVVTHSSGVTLIFRWEAPGVRNLEQRITLFTDQPEIELIASMYKTDDYKPESIYFAFPLNLQPNWQATYDTAGTYVNLDDEQLPGVCRDWVMVDQTVSVYDQTHGITLACPDAPLVQIGDFHFGKEQNSIERCENPVLLAWPMNNYWDTNFRANQPGHVTFKYVLSSIQDFDPIIAKGKGVKASEPIQVFPAVQCISSKEYKFLHVEGEVIPYYVKTSEDGQAMIVRFHNVREQTERVELEWIDRIIKRVHRTDPMESILEDLELSDGKICVLISAKSWLSLRIEAEY